MKEFDEFVTKVAEKYRKQGFRVTLDPPADQMPKVLEDASIRFIAAKEKQTVAVQIVRRDELADLLDVNRLADQLRAESGWQLESILSPSNGVWDRLRHHPDFDQSQIEDAMEEVELALDAGLERAAFLLAWAALEASMRDLARRADVLSEREPPMAVLESLCTMGLISREDFFQFTDSHELRFALEHGISTRPIEADDVRKALDFIGRLKEAEVEEAVA